MVHPRTKHAVNNPRGEKANPAEPPMEFKPRLSKMLAPLDALRWNGLRPLPTDVYSNLVTSVNGALGATQTKELKKEFKLFHRRISVDSSEEEEGEEESSHHAMEIEGQFVNEEIPQQIEEIPEEQSDQIHQLQEGQPMQEGHPPHEGPSSQEGPPAWVLELKATMERIE
ncbi:hypothetical protein Acr_27g0001920 [Actinidia rufa]|uniref:Uncharacterized protein n=1 Tax=Actinidia rufa TaxID=165716 RepID=A0A7J0H5S5_9ERIC|nr:hypothetical protein Acr_27g0001920 [Actinidia rufa]